MCSLGPGLGDRAGATYSQLLLVRFIVCSCAIQEASASRFTVRTNLSSDELSHVVLSSMATRPLRVAFIHPDLGIGPYL